MIPYKSVLTTYNYFASIYNPDNSNPYIMVQAKPGITSRALQDELNGVMRQLRKLSPTQEDNFTCNESHILSLKDINNKIVDISVKEYLELNNKQDFHV